MTITPTSSWWYLSFCDTTKPVGQQFQGAAVVQGVSMEDAIQNAWRLKINPGGEVLGYSLGSVDPSRFNQLAPESLRNKLLTRQEMEEAGWKPRQVGDEDD